MSRIAQRALLQIMFLALMSFGLAGCALGESSVARPAPTPLAKALPTLEADPGFHTVLSLGNSGSYARAGSFVASKPYAVSFTCIGNGSGKLMLTYGAVEQIMTCGPTPEPYGTQTFPATGGSLDVFGATTDPSVHWVAIIEVQS